MTNTRKYSDKRADQDRLVRDLDAATQPTYKGMTAAQYRDAAKKSRERVRESWERSDTDGFVSQWAGDLTAQMYDLQAKLMEEGGTAEFPALFDLEGNMIAAKLITSYNKFSHSYHYNTWMLLSSDDPHSESVQVVKLSEAQNEDTAIKNNAKKGYYVGTVLAPAAADMAGANRTSVHVIVTRVDGGFSRDAQIVDNGQIALDHAHVSKRSGKLVKQAQQIEDKAVATLSKTAKGRKLVKDAKTTAKTTKKQTPSKTRESAQDSSAKPSRAASASHADCKHESSKAARAKCRRERASNK